MRLLHSTTSPTTRQSVHFSVSASELDIQKRRKFDEFGQNISIPFDISEMKWRILVPHNKLFIICTIYTDCVNICDSKQARD